MLEVVLNQADGPVACYPPTAVHGETLVGVVVAFLVGVLVEKDREPLFLRNQA